MLECTSCEVGLGVVYYCTWKAGSALLCRIINSSSQVEVDTFKSN